VIVIVQDPTNANEGDFAFSTADVHFNYFPYLGSHLGHLGSLIGP
jgi:hypothetical protein